jgi:predicted phage tail protein
MPSPATLLWGMLFGAIGVGYFIYGKKQAMIVPLVCGVVLMVYPWFVSGAWLTVIVGIALMAVPYFVRY